MAKSRFHQRVRDLEKRDGDQSKWERIADAARSLASLGFGFDREVMSEAEVDARVQEYLVAQRGTAFGQHRHTSQVRERRYKTH